MTGGRERVRQDEDRVERVGWTVKTRGGTWAGKTAGNCRLGTGLRSGYALGYLASEVI